MRQDRGRETGVGRRVTVRRVKRGAVRERLKIVRGGGKGGRGLGRVTEEKIA